MEIDEVRRKVDILYQLWLQDLIPRTEVHEVYPELSDSDPRKIIYFTLPVSLNFQRSSTAMWQSALKTFEDNETNYLFTPSEVIKLPREKIQSDLTKHKLALQRNKHTDVWIKLSQTFVEYGGTPYSFFEEYDFDVIEIIHALRKKHKSKFPFLSGAKMSNYWLFILHHFTSIKFKNPEKISIIPDTHVIKASMELGLIENISSPESVAALWEEVLNGTKLSPIDLHPVLWHWSRAKFSPKIH